MVNNKYNEYLINEFHIDPHVLEIIENAEKSSPEASQISMISVLYAR